VRFCNKVVGHGVPPLESGVRIVRFANCKPPPHGCVQTLQSDQSLMTQLTGHGWMLQDCVDIMADAGHAPPLVAGLTTVRVRVRTPPLQAAEQAE
jgi:hypothetical protein